MKIKLILFALLFSSIKFAHAQNQESILASAKYKVKLSQNNVLKIDDVCQLDITKNQSYFYSLGMQENLKSIAEKSRIADQTGKPLQLTYKDIKIRLFRFTTIKKLISKQVILQEQVGSQSLGYVVDTIDTKGWKILSETMKINNLNCRKAEITKGKSKATAWFCGDIPIHDGPIYAAGLPGLIVKFSTSTGWEAELVSFNYNKGVQKQLKIAPYALVSEAQFKKAKNNNTASSKDGISINGDKIEKVKN